MHPSCDIEPSPAVLRAAFTSGPEVSLGDLIELVSCAVPEDEVAETVVALFDHGIASFARLLPRDERAALRSNA